MSTAVAKANPVTEVNMMLADREPEFKAALPPHISIERFMRVMMTAVQNNPPLARVEKRSLFLSAIKAAQDGLLPDGREAALVIYKDKNRGEIAQYMPMIAGLRKKVRNSGEISTWDAQVVHEGDQFEYELGDKPFIRHKPAMGERGKVIGAYSVAVLKTGQKSREVMSVGEIEAIRKRSRASGNGPWVTDYSEMCRKTVARRHSKVLPMSTDLDNLIRRDDDLYDMAGGSDKALPDNRPKTLEGRMDALAAPRQQAAAETDDADTIDSETGEVTNGDDHSSDPIGDDDQGSEDPNPVQSEKKSEQAAEKPVQAWGTEASVKAAYDRGVQAKQKNMARRALPPEYREEAARAEADAWENGWDDEAAKVKGGAS